MGLDIYGTNDSAQFNIPYDVSNLTMLTKLNSTQYTFTNNQVGTFTLNTSVSFRYYVFIETVLSSPHDLTLELTFNYQQSGVPTLDSSGLIKSSEIPQTYVKQICGKTTSNNDIVINLSDLNDTNITEPENNNFLQYNASTNKWINQAVTIDTTLSSLSDVNVGSISSNQGLYITKINGRIKQYHI